MIITITSGENVRIRGNKTNKKKQNKLEWLLIILVLFRPATLVVFFLLFLFFFPFFSLILRIEIVEITKTGYARQAKKKMFWELWLMRRSAARRYFVIIGFQIPKLFEFGLFIFIYRSIDRSWEWQWKLSFIFKSIRWSDAFNRLALIQ